LGNAYRYKGRYQEALEKQEEAKALSDSSQNPLIYSRIDLNLGAIHEAIGNYGMAFKYYLRSIEGAETAGDSVLLSTGLNNLGVAYNNHSDPEKAQYYLHRSIDIKKKIHDRVGLLMSTVNLAISANKLHKYDESIALYEQAMKLHKVVRKDVPPFRILYNMGQVYKDKGDLARAEDCYKQSLSYCKQAGIPQGLIYNYGGLANVAELRHDITKARDNYTQALHTAEDIGAVELQKDALKSLYLLEKGQSNFKRALNLHEKYTALNDSLNKEASQQELAGTEAKLNLRRQEEINKLLQEKQQQQEARLTTQNWLIAAGLGIIIVVLGSVILLVKSNVEKQRINSELESQRNKLEELNKVKDKILAIIAHDLRSPLASMQGMIYLIREKELTKKEIAEMAAELEVSISQNISMMDNLLVWAREQMSGLALNIKAVNAREIVKEVFDNYQFQAQHKGVQLANKVSEGLKVKADHNLLKLILRNLVSNSIKFCKEGDRLTVSTREEEGKVIFEVEDTGIGIPETKKAGLFSSNSGSRNGTNDEKGSGLGLQLCKEFIEKQDGHISVESVEGEGATFIFSLPRGS
jgi:signal transduction histidine kinase